MTIEEWLQAQKQAGSVSLPLYIDENGNQCMQTHAYATRYGNSNVEMELNKLGILDMNDKGVIEVPEGTNPKELHISGLYWTKAWADGSIPLPSSYCVIRVVACADNIVFLTAYYPTSHVIFTNSSYGDAKVWFGWKLISGEVPLWSGNLQTGTIACAYDLSMFGSFEIIATNDIAIPCSIYNNRIFGTVGLPYADYTNIYYISGMIDAKNFTINRFKVQGLSSSIVLTQGTAIKIIGRP